MELRQKSGFQEDLTGEGVACYREPEAPAGGFGLDQGVMSIRSNGMKCGQLPGSSSSQGKEAHSAPEAPFS